MAKKITLNEKDYVTLLTQTPSIIGVLYYDVLENKGVKIPRRDSVVKAYKGNVEGFIGYSFNHLSDYQRHTLIKTAEDAYYGIREAETEE